MRASLRFTGVVVLSAMALAGCHRMADRADEAPVHGRYAGVGIYGPGKSWTRLIAAQQKADGPAARTIDDQAIIVMVDSTTGEVRSCGDMTGYCVGMNPWKTALAGAQLAPVDLTEHVKPEDPDLTATPVPRSHRRLPG